jgi:hypothetical protein
MSNRPFLPARAALAAALALALHVVPGAAHAATAFAVVDTTLVRIETADSSIAAQTPITGLVAGDEIVGIDVRPQNGMLYGLGYNPVAGTVQLYAISYRTAVARPIGAPAAFVTAGGAPRPVGAGASTRFGFDFNPTVDRVRVVNSAGQNFRINPNNGAPVDGDAVNAGVQMDGDVNGATTAVDGTAYTNAVANTTITTQYTLDASTDAIHIQNPPNAGVQTLALPLTLGGSPLDVDAAGGFDIEPGVNAPASNAPVASGTATALLRVAGVAALYRVDLVSGAATLAGTPVLPAGTLRGFAVLGAAVPGEFAAIALSGNGTQLVRFNTGTPGTQTVVTLTGLVAGESLVGIDWRPATGQLFGVGVDENANNGTVYVIDPQTAATTAIGVSGQLQWVDTLGNTVDLPAASAGWGIDFNPTVDRIRLVNATGLNARANPITGAPIDGDAGSAGIQPDGALSVSGGGAALIASTAYSNSFDGTTITTQYTLDAAQSRLYIQDPPNNGTQTAPRPVTLGGAPLAFTAVSGFDIPPSVQVGAANAPVDFGFGLALLEVAGVGSLYRIELGSGAATLVGTLVGAAPRGLAVGDGPSPIPVFANGFEPIAP